MLLAMAMPVFEVARLDDRQHRAEDLLLRDGGLGIDVGDDCGLDEVALAGFFRRPAAGDEPSAFGDSLLDVAEDRLHRLLVDDRAHAGVRGGIADRDLLYPRLQRLHEAVVDALVDDDARAGRALLSAETERRLRGAFDGSVEVGVGIDHHGVLAAHLENGALDPDLAGLLRGCGLVDVQADFLRSGEGDVARLGMRDDGVAEARCRARDSSSPRRRAGRLLPGSP